MTCSARGAATGNWGWAAPSCRPACIACQDAGATAALLNVDGENPTGALALYQFTGFQTQFALINYCKDLG